MPIAGSNLLMIQDTQERKDCNGDQGSGGNGNRLKNPPHGAEHGHAAHPQAAAGKSAAAKKPAAIAAARGPANSADVFARVIRLILAGVCWRGDSRFTAHSGSFVGGGLDFDPNLICIQSQMG